MVLGQGKPSGEKRHGRQLRLGRTRHERNTGKDEPIFHVCIGGGNPQWIFYHTGRPPDWGGRENHLRAGESSSYPQHMQPECPGSKGKKGLCPGNPPMDLPQGGDLQYLAAVAPGGWENHDAPGLHPPDFRGDAGLAGQEGGGSGRAQRDSGQLPWDTPK